MNENEVIHTTLTDQLTKALEERNMYYTVLMVTWVLIAVWIVFNVFTYKLTQRMAVTYETVCPACNYNLCVPTPVPTPILK